MRYYTPYGDEYTTHAIRDVFGTSNDNARARMEIALESLPNQVVTDVIVKSDTTSPWPPVADIYARRYEVTFQPDEVNSVNMGMMNTMKCENAYTCTEPGCQPMVKMPFLYRYAYTTSAVSASSGTFAFAATGVITYVTVANNPATLTNAYSFVRLHADSQPQLPAGVEADTGFAATQTGRRRYDMRILVAVVDNDDGVNNDADNFYIRVISGHNNITSAKETVFGLQGPFTNDAPSNGGSPYSGKTLKTDLPTGSFSLAGFTFMGQIPEYYRKVPIPGAPGAYLEFPQQNMVGNNMATVSEILIKLPTCTVTPYNRANQFQSITGTQPPVINMQVENIECSGRGMCNRQTGECACFEGYYGISCHKQTTLL
jgi:hypothetical protein